MMYIQKLFTLFITLAILIGLPYFIGHWGVICVSWFPALFAFLYLDDKI